MSLDLGSLPLELALAVDRLCNRFESGWREGRRPRIEDALIDAPLPARAAALRALIASEYELRLAEGDTPSLEEYLARFPEATEVVREALTTTDAGSSAPPAIELPSTPQAQCADPTETRIEPTPRRLPHAASRPAAGPASPGNATGLPDRIGDFRPTRLLGQGGFGWVYLAWDEELQREVALKVARPGALGGRDREEVLLSEARTAASLRHPGIVTIYRVGRFDTGQPFVAMEFVEGGSLGDLLKESRIGWERLASCLAAVAEAAHHAHESRIVHRDLNPANILIDRKGEPRVTDFGLAVSDDRLRGLVGEVAGTPSYMAPEQVRGESHRLDGRTDIWAIGVILYLGLTDRLPFAGRTRPQLYEEILTREPRPPRQLDAAIPAELERICLKCLAKPMTERYRSAIALAEDLRTWIAAPAGKPVGGGGSFAVESTAEVAGHLCVAPKGLRAFDAADAGVFLSLLPGPRGRDGLPESIRFWRSRLGLARGTGAGRPEPFPVGLLYGPSGGGKTSFVRAGLIPRLEAEAGVVCLDATPEGTEDRLLAALYSIVPGLKPDEGTATDLARALARLRAEGPIALGAEHSKIVMVLDQFEQWLQAHPARSDNELVGALRQCDGHHVQALLLVRDDFWMAVTRFFRELEVPLAEGLNSAPVELLDTRHARAVLETFGRACGRFTGPDDQPTPDEARFLDAAITALVGADGRIIPIRLSLLAEVVRNRPWHPGTLRELGGIEGIGETFLTETFDGPTSPPVYRAHCRGAESVLSALLPPTGSVLRAPAQSITSLRTAAGYGSRAAEFDDLLSALDRNLRLITLVDPETAPGVSREPAYQLAHDKLIDPIRRWLERKEGSTRAGRARLRLASITASWVQRPERRRLPSLMEWASILVASRPSTWKADERRMMRAAALHHVGRAIAVLAVLGVLGYGIAEVRRRDRASDLLQRAVASDPRALPTLIPALLPHLDRLLPEAERLERDPTQPPRGRQTAGLIVFHARPTPDRTSALLARIVEATPEELGVIRDALARHPGVVPLDQLRSRLTEESDEPPSRIRVAGVLARLDPRSTATLDPTVAASLAGAILGEDRRTLPRWLELLDPVLETVAPHLEVICSDPSRDAATRSQAAEAVAALHARRGDTAALARAVVKAPPDAGRVLLRELMGLGPALPAIETLNAVRDEPAPGAVDDETREAHAARRANAAVALAALGEPDALWPLLRHADDPRVRSRAIDALARSGAAASVVLPRLARSHDGLDAVELQALLLALAESDRDAFQGPARGPAAQAVARLYTEHPDAGVHSAALLLLRRWGRDDLIARSDPQIANRPPAAQVEHRGWMVGPNGHTFVTLRGPLTFRMGSPEGEPWRFPREALHVRRIDRHLAVGTTEVTEAQYLVFCKETGRKHNPDPRHGTDPDAPAHELTWYDAVAYCNWLSRRAGLEPAYPEPVQEGMKVPGNIATRRGYRLPTEAEWEYACRAGTTTARPFGSSDDLLPRYGWTWLNSGNRLHPVARLLPNELGLFDVMGNVWEWCHDGMPPFGGDGFTSYPPGTADAPAPDESRAIEVVKNREIWRILRGGGFPYAPSESRSAHRYAVEVDLHDPYLGFRLVRTLSP